MDNMILTENDFYQIEENKNFLLFKIFFEKCSDLIKNDEILEGKYLIESLKIKSKISDDLEKSQLKFELIDNLIDENNLFYNKILVIYDNDKQKAQNIYNKIKENLEICKNKLLKFEIIEEYYNTFLENTKKRIITIIKNRLSELKKENLNEILKINDIEIIVDEDFNLETSIKEIENIKYKNSLFFMSIYKEKYNSENYEKTEQEILDESKKDFENAITRIINQKETKEPFFEINNINEIMKVINNGHENIQEEIQFIEKEFAHLDKQDYIKNDLLEDLINFSNKEKIQRLIEGILYFIQAYSKIVNIQETEFLGNLIKENEILKSKSVSGEQIKDSIKLLEKLNYNINKETSLIKFYELFLGKEESLFFIKKIKDANLEIRNLNEFIDENENSQLQTTDIDNLLDVYTFFKTLMENKDIKTDENFYKKFRTNFEKKENIIIKLQGYLSSYGEIIQLFQLYDENPEMTTQKIYNLLKNSIVEIFNENNDYFSYHIKYMNQSEKIIEADINEIDELKNKILISSTNTNLIKEEGTENNINKEKLTNNFIVLIDNIKQLINTLNSLLKSGYPKINNLTLKIEDSNAFEANKKENDLQKIIEEYKIINKKYRKLIQKGYEKFPLLRLFYGKQLIQIYEKINNKEINISHLVNSMVLNKIKNFEIEFQYNNEIDDNIENINRYLEKLFEVNNINLDEIYKNNEVMNDLNISPGLYRKVREGDYSELIINIINIYINITGNCPIKNTLLICNEETNIEKIKAFFYRAIFCDKPILFVIANLECLELSVTQNIIKILYSLYKMKNRNINSYLLIIYRKVESGLGRDIEKLIPEKNILFDSFLKEPKKKVNIFNDTELYSSKYAGYGKTTEIMYKVEEKKGKYYYLPIGGSFIRNYVINNIENLHLDLENSKEIYLHVNLSETENDNLMNEILFNLLILRFIESNEKIYYLGNDANIIIEIPRGFYIFEDKYKILKLFKKIYIDKLCPLRLEKDVKKISDSPISIVAEILESYETGEIGTSNINLDAPLRKTANECEKIINRHFTVENQNYYQKMNFIKILSLQFKQFNESIYYQKENTNLTDELFKKIRFTAIKNFIILTKVFTRSPYDTVLLKQIETLKLFGKYDEKKIIENLEKEKQEIFSFKLIKPSLVFFNKDGQSLSIITNNDKNDPEYKDWQALWNNQNYPNSTYNELVDYKNLKHENFLEEIQKLFDLKSWSIDEIKMRCENLGNYIFVSDNYIKMVRILLSIQAKIPVILMGETGVGKTKLLEILSIFYGEGESNWKILQIHAGTTDQKIVEFIDKITEEVKMEGNENIDTWVFLDEINTCNSLGLISEIMCNHTYLGKKISDKFIFIAACNPYRIMTKKMRESGLVYYNMKETNKLNNLVYAVNPLPHSLLNFVIDFGSLKFEDEKKYITNTIIEVIEKIQAKGLIKNITDEELNKAKDEIIQSIIICHNYVREIYDISSVSMREIRRFGLFLDFFIKYFEKRFSNPYLRMIYSSNITLYLCYYLRLNDKKNRNELAEKLKNFIPNKKFKKIPELEIRKIANQMNIEKNKGIALNRALKENLFTTFICVINNVPLIIIGKPGTSKSLSFQILYNTMKGQYSNSKLFKDKGKLYRYYYQGSETSTAEGIEQVFSKALNAQIKNKNNNIITLVFFDEMGLAERSSNNPLKVIHYLLEKDNENSVPFLGISNWKLDASKINRALSLTITDYDIEDLEETAFSIAEALDTELSNKYKEFFEVLARTYNKYMIICQNDNLKNKDFHGNRDFYNLIKNAMRELIKKKSNFKNKFEIHENKILTRIGIICLERNFGGLEDSTQKIKEIFRNEFGYKFNQEYDIEKKTPILDIIKSNILDPNSRYLMLISDGNDGSDIIKYLLNSMKKNFIELVGSKYKNDLKSGKYSEEILNKIKYIMETDNILILRDLDMIYPSLYDLFNQNFTSMGDKKYARIAFEYAKISSEVNKDFHVIIIVNKNKIEDLKLDPPFLNRFEKHIITFRLLLEEKDIEISEKINDYIKLISSFNYNDNLKLDLEKLLVNCERHNIEGLIFKIKNENIVKKNEPQYEIKLIKEIFKKIVPTFCQDIIASIINSNYEVNYHQINDIVIKLYKEEKILFHI